MRRLTLFVALAVFVAMVSPALAEADGKSLYEAKCSMCHGKDGIAKPMAKGSGNFNDPAWQKANDAAAIEKVATDGKGKMPAYKDKLKPEEIKAVAAFVKTIK